MLLSKIQNIEISIGIDLLFTLDKLEIFEYDIIGITGKNGSGKTTLLNILSGYLEPDSGYVKNFCEFSYFRQFNQYDELDYLSGGEQTKLFLSEALNKNAPLLILDEPTSNLDISAIKLLEKQIINYNGAVVLISHDRKLLENTCTRIVNIENKKAAVYDCSYGEFLDIKEKEAERAEFLYESYNKERRRLIESIRESQSKVKSAKKTPTRMGNSEARLHKRETGQRMESVEAGANALKTRLEKLEVHEKPRKQRKIGIELKNIADSSYYKGRYIIECDDLSVAFGDRILFENANFRINTGNKTVLIGDNGSGKTTLIKKILDKDCENIKLNAKKVAYYSQGLDILDSSKTILENVMLENAFTELEARNILGRLDIREDNVYKKVQNISGGEKVKVCFAKIFTQGADLIILDEPTNYLDITTTQVLEDIIGEYDGTILAVSHDRSFAENISDSVLEIDAKEKKIKYFDVGYGEIK